MSTKNPVILLLEDSLITGVRIERMVFSRLPECRLVWARNIEDAQLRAMWLSIDLFLLDVELPDGNGLDFLCEMATVLPNSQAIVLTSMRVGDSRERSEALGVLRFLEKPVDLKILEEQIRMSIGAGSSEEGVAGDAQLFQATLNNLTPVDIIQLKCLTQSSSVVEFRSESKTGRVHVVNGSIIHAESGELSGMDAFAEIVRWKGGKIVELPVPAETQKTITGDWQSLLMEAAQSMDEDPAS